MTKTQVTRPTSWLETPRQRERARDGRKERLYLRMYRKSLAILCHNDMVSSVADFVSLSNKVRLHGKLPCGRFAVYPMCVTSSLSDRTIVPATLCMTSIRWYVRGGKNRPASWIFSMVNHCGRVDRYTLLTMLCFVEAPSIGRCAATRCNIPRRAQVGRNQRHVSISSRIPSCDHLSGCLDASNVRLFRDINTPYKCRLSMQYAKACVQPVVNMCCMCTQNVSSLHAPTRTRQPLAQQTGNNIPLAGLRDPIVRFPNSVQQSTRPTAWCTIRNASGHCVCRTSRTESVCKCSHLDKNIYRPHAVPQRFRATCDPCNPFNPTNDQLSEQLVGRNGPEARTGRPSRGVPNHRKTQRVTASRWLYGLRLPTTSPSGSTNVSSTSSFVYSLKGRRHDPSVCLSIYRSPCLSVGLSIGRSVGRSNIALAPLPVHLRIRVKSPTPLL